jgi:hypothetical protein
MKTCATMMHRPDMSMPIRPSPIASVCMTRGRTVPFDVWKRKTMTMNVRRVVSLSITSGLDAPSTRGASAAEKLKLGFAGGLIFPATGVPSMSVRLYRSADD